MLAGGPHPVLLGRSNATRTSRRQRALLLSTVSVVVSRVHPEPVTRSCALTARGGLICIQYSERDDNSL